MLSFSSGARQYILENDLARLLYRHLLYYRARLNTYHGKDLAALDSLLRGIRAEGYDAANQKTKSFLHDLIRRHCYESGSLQRLRKNGFLWRFQRSDEARRMRGRVREYSLDSRVRFRPPDWEVEKRNPRSQGQIFALKPSNPDTAEKGVLLIKYTKAIRRFVALFDVASVVSNYTLVLEPSSWGYEDSTFMFYLGSDAEIVVQAPYERDYRFLREFDQNLVPIRIGAGDWVDATVFRKREDVTEEFDIAMVSSWHPLKRHKDLFAVIPEVEEALKRKLRVALVGYPAGWTSERIRKLSKKYEVEDRCRIYESVPHEKVARILAGSKVYVLLSRREGANKALYESLFADTPVIVPKGHRGINDKHIGKETGTRFQTGELGAALVDVLRDPSRFSPRKWAEEHTGYRNATRKLNDLLRNKAHRENRPWTVDIVPKVNAPNQEYTSAGVRERLDPVYESLKEYLLE